LPRVAVFGAGGVGKSTVGKFLAGTLTDEELLKGYLDSFATEKLPISERSFGHVLVASGQRRRQSVREELLELVRDGKIGGVINVVAYGYHSFPGDAEGFRNDAAFRDGMDPPAFMDAYLAARRRDELEQLSEAADALSKAPKPLWLLTLVAKQDLWWDRREEVETHYSGGEYKSLIDRIVGGRGKRGFRHELVSAALTWENLSYGSGETLAKTAAGYDHAARSANLARFGRAVRQMLDAVS
jgi:hypothetical protein